MSPRIYNLSRFFSLLFFSLSVLSIKSISNISGVLEGDLSGIQPAFGALGVVGTAFTHFMLFFLTLAGLIASLGVKPSKSNAAAAPDSKKCK